jgi:hypothetical protein
MVRTAKAEHPCQVDERRRTARIPTVRTATVPIPDITDEGSMVRWGHSWVCPDTIHARHF